MLNSNEHRLILLINIKMPTIVGILTFISKINTTSESFKARQILFFSILVNIMSSWNFLLSLVEHEESLMALGPGSANVFSYAPSYFPLS